MDQTLQTAESEVKDNASHRERLSLLLAPGTLSESSFRRSFESSFLHDKRPDLDRAMSPNLDYFRGSGWIHTR